MSSKRINDRIAEAQLVFAVDKGGNIRQIKNRFSCYDKGAVDLQVMVEQIANLRLAAGDSALRYNELGEGTMYRLVDGQYDPTTGYEFDTEDGYARVIAGYSYEAEGCSDDCGIDSRCSDDCGFDSERWESENREGQCDAAACGSCDGCTDPTLGSVGRTIGDSIGGLALLFLVALGREEVEDLVQPGFGERGEYGDTGVVNTGEPYRDAADDFEMRGIDATANPDLVEAWAHALEVADATD